MGVHFDRWDKKWAFDPLDLQAASIVYPVSNNNGAPTDTRFKNMPGSSSVLLDDGRVAYLWHEDPGNGVSQIVYLGFADSEADFYTNHQSVTHADRVPIFHYGLISGGNVAQIAASLSRQDQYLVLMVASDAHWENLEVGDRTRVAGGASGWMCFNSGTMYGIGGTSATRTDRLWTVDLSDGQWTVVKKLYDDPSDAATPWNFGDNVGGLAHNGTSMFCFDDNTNTLHTVDLTESQLSSSIGGTGVTGELDMAWDGSTMWGITSSNLYQVNTGTGAWSSAVACVGLVSIAYDSTAGTMYGLSATTLYTVNTGTGALTSVGSTGLITARGLAYDSASDTLYCLDGSGTLYSFDDPTTDGSISTIGSPTYSNYMNFWPGWGTFVYTSDDNGKTWNGGISHLAWSEYQSQTGPPTYQTDGAGLRPHTYAYVDPTVAGGNPWARYSFACMGSAFRSSHSERWYIAGVVLHRDGSNNLNHAWPALFQLGQSGTPTLVQRFPIEDPVNINEGEAWEADYDEATLGDDYPGWGWIPGQELTVRDAAGTTTEEDHYPHPNLMEIDGEIWLVTAGLDSPQTRLYKVTGLPTSHRTYWVDETTSFGNAGIEVNGMWPMEFDQWDGKMLLASNQSGSSSASSGESDSPPGSSLAGFWYGPRSNLGPINLDADTWTRQTKTVGAHTTRNYHWRLVNGDEKVWTHCTDASRYQGIRTTDWVPPPGYWWVDTIGMNPGEWA